MFLLIQTWIVVNNLTFGISYRMMMISASRAINANIDIMIQAYAQPLKLEMSYKTIRFSFRFIV